MKTGPQRVLCSQWGIKLPTLKADTWEEVSKQFASQECFFDYIASGRRTLSSWLTEDPIDEVKPALHKWLKQKSKFERQAICSVLGIPQPKKKLTQWQQFYMQDKQATT